MNGDEKDEKNVVKIKIDDLFFYCIGFKFFVFEYIFCMCIWVFFCFQIFYCIVFGFMNYSCVIKFFYCVENFEVVQMFGGNLDKFECEFECMVCWKFKFVVFMQ